VFASGGIFWLCRYPLEEGIKVPELVSQTVRIRRGWLDRLRGLDHLYETKLTDGYRVAIGRGTFPSISQYHAQRIWATRVGQVTKMTDYDLSSPAPSIALNAGHSTSLEGLREVIDALRADNGKLLRLLIKRFANDGATGAG
jgi:hypothetical protein